jgi:hypothetical protein
MMQKNSRVAFLVVGVLPLVGYDAWKLEAFLAGNAAASGRMTIQLAENQDGLGVFASRGLHA